jgi:hypothetical protein
MSKIPMLYFGHRGAPPPRPISYALFAPSLSSLYLHFMHYMIYYKDLIQNYIPERNTLSNSTVRVVAVSSDAFIFEDARQEMLALEAQAT